MKKILLATTATLALAAGISHASDGQWAYSGEQGPEYWNAVDPAFAICAKGMNQSPLDLTGFMEAELPPLVFDYTGLVTKIRHNGSIMQADYAAGSTFTVNSRIFELQQ
ncbi:MAG: carbonic anhydrase, partial [Candidatus Electrothrix sp. AR3]|nr:carbonic anhydrase [Candidatus Electrothrix sp. AR3]